MLIPQYPILVLKLSPIYMVSLNTVFKIPQNQCYPGTPCSTKSGWLFTLFYMTFDRKKCPSLALPRGNFCKT